MSSTNRGSLRQEADLYPTPISAFLPLISHLPKVSIWEPACGDRRLINCLEEHGFIAHGSDLEYGYDFLKDNRRHTCIVTNPPFSLAFEFCQHAVKNADDVFLLLRLNFLASKKRREWFRNHEPYALLVLSERPRFVDNRSDSCDYAWFYWASRAEGDLRSVLTGIYHL